MRGDQNSLQLASPLANNNSDFGALVLRLERHGNPPAEDAQGHEILAMFLRLVEGYAPRVAAMLHRPDERHRPFTLTLLPQTCPGPVRDLRVSILRPDVIATLWAALYNLPVDAAVNLGASQAYYIREIFGTTQGHPLADTARMHDLGNSVARKVTLEFITPTAVRRGRNEYPPFPQPDLVFGSLARRWNSVVPPYLAVDLDALERYAFDDIRVGRYEIRQERALIKEVLIPGWVGRCAYQLPDSQDTESLTLLARAAFYLGVGVKTTMGMGLCRMLPERPHQRR